MFKKKTVNKIYKVVLATATHACFEIAVTLPLPVQSLDI